MTPQTDTEQGLSRQRSRSSIAIFFAVAFALHFAAINSQFFDAVAIVAINDLAWTVFGLASAAICLLAALRLSGGERRAWFYVSLGCVSWTLGQCVWNYYELHRGRLPIFPHWMQLLFIGYPILLVMGLLSLPKPGAAHSGNAFSMRHLANLGLIACTLVGALVITITEPAANSNRTLASLAVSLFQCTAYAIACMTALYLLWSYRWQTAHWPLVLATIGSGIHATALIADMHSRIAGTYHANDWVNAAWLIALALVACAAHEYAHAAKRPIQKSSHALRKRERMLEAIMPAFLVLIVTTTAVINAQWISVRVIYFCAGIGMAFAVLLGIREGWIQREEQRLLAALSASNADLLDANQSLSHSEQGYRQLNQELESHVAERTRNLQRAYEELESFSYAVAHDLKAPLRAVDGFGALLAGQYGERLDDQGRSYLARMRRGALTMAELVDDLLAYARIDRRESHVMPTTLGELVQRCLDEQREEIAGAGIALEVDVEKATLTMDGEGLGIALRNVLQNAIKFGSTAAAPRIAVYAKFEDRRLTLLVSDNGIGFDMQYHDRIFAMFQRLHRSDQYPGNGIGLAIARKAIERAGGRIWAESAVGAGATFHIELPAA